MTIFERIRDKWRKFLSIFRRGEKDVSASGETPTDSIPSDTSPTPEPEPPVVVSEPVYLDVGMAYTLEGPQGKERPRVEVWPLQPSETRVAIVTAGREINAEIINGFERKQNPQTNASWPSLLISNCATQIAVKITNSRVGVLTFGGIDPAKFATFHQKVALK